MTSRNTLLTALALGMMVSASVAIAQDQTAASAMQDQATADQTATSAPADPAAAPPATATDPTTSQSPPGTASQGAAGAGATQQLTWSDLDTDKDGKLSKTEVVSIPNLAQVFDSADTDQDGLLTPDEYKAYVAAGNQGASAPPAAQQPGEQP